MRPVELIGRKRDGGELSREEYAAFVGGYLDGSVMEGQMAALLMAGVLRGFSDAEARALTDVLVGSGATLDLSSIEGPTIDKHSTGGVGDGTSLLVAPLLAAAGCTLVKLSGRGLGHSGGTLDKLESIPGMRVALPEDEILRIAREIGCVVAAQTEALVPADKALYALRDVTGTVASMALIASSVMSKKLAAGAGTIVLDVKTGDGAFMATREDAVALARLCVGIGVDAGRRCSALVTDMDTPLGGGIGNALEVRESVLLLQKAPDPEASRLTEVALALATEAYSLATASEPATARRDLELLWAGGEPLERLRRMIAAQGGDPRVVDDPDAVLPVRTGPPRGPRRARRRRGAHPGPRRSASSRSRWAPAAASRATPSTPRSASTCTSPRATASSSVSRSRRSTPAPTTRPRRPRRSWRGSSRSATRVGGPPRCWRPFAPEPRAAAGQATPHTSRASRARVRAAWATSGMGTRSSGAWARADSPGP